MIARSVRWRNTWANSSASVVLPAADQPSTATRVGYGRTTASTTRATSASIAARMPTPRSIPYAGSLQQGSILPDGHAKPALAADRGHDRIFHLLFMPPAGTMGWVSRCGDGRG